MKRILLVLAAVAFAAGCSGSSDTTSGGSNGSNTTSSNGSSGSNGTSTSASSGSSGRSTNSSSSSSGSGGLTAGGTTGFNASTSGSNGSGSNTTTNGSGSSTAGNGSGSGSGGSTGTSAGPSNDLCSGAIELSAHAPGDPDAVVNGDTTEADDEFEASCGGYGHDVFYTLNLTSRALVTASVASPGSSRYEDVSIVTDCTAAANSDSLACDDGSELATATQILNAGTYIIVADNNSGDDGPFTLTVSVATAPPPPANDLCSAATDLTVAAPGDTQTVTGDTTDAAGDYASASCSGGGGDVYFHLHLTADASLSANLTPDNTSNATTLELLPAACSGSEIACANGTFSSASLNVSALVAGDYILVADSPGGDEGPFTLDISLGQPVFGDSCAQPLALTDNGGGNFTASGDNTAYNDDFSASCGGSGPDVFYALHLDADSSVTVTATPTQADGGGLNPIVSILSGCGSSDAQVCGGGDGAGQPGTVTAPNLSGNADYIIVVDGYSSSIGAFDLSVQVGAPIPPPANDTCSGTIPALTVGTSVNVDTSLATDQFSVDSTSCPDVGFSAGDGAPDVVYSFTPPADGSYDITFTANGFDGIAYILGTTCAEASPATCVTGGEAYFGDTTMTVDLLASNTYYLVVDGDSTGDQGPFSLDVVATPPPPSNDTCATAIDLGAAPNQTVTSDTSQATNDYTQDTGHACTGYKTDGPDLVYSFTPSIDGTYTFTLTPTSADLALYVLDTCPTAPIAACLAGSDTGFSGDPETISVALTHDVPYLVFVDGYSSGGSFTLSVTGP